MMGLWFSYRDLEVFTSRLLEAESRGSRYLYRTAASFVRVRAGLAERPLLTPVELLADQETKVGGLVVVGSYVPKTTQQLNSLLAKSDIQGLRIDVVKLLEDD